MILWSDGLRLGYGPMDDTHEEFVQLIANCQGATDDELVELLARLEAHTQEHFEEEDRWMEETDFPPRECHMEQHAAVLKSIREVRALLDQGDRAVARSLVDALADWFPNHATHLDSALAHWMFKRKYGGKPVVIHRVKTAVEA